MIDIPQLTYPLALTGGDFAQVEQGTLDDVRQNVLVLLRTPLGVRPLAPDVGVQDPTFTTVDPEALQATLTDADTGEPRARVTVTADPIDPAGEQRVAVDVALADDAEE
jgi:phage baseplate assembly protein W